MNKPPSVIRTQLDQWERTADPRHLWPGVEPEERMAALLEIERATQAVLTGSAERPSLAIGQGFSVRALGIAAYTSGMGPLLGCWIDSGALHANAEVAALLALHLEHSRHRARRLHGELTRVLDALRDEEISGTVLKGMHTAYRYFPEPGARPVADIDLLVPQECFPRACDVLRAAGLVLVSRNSLPDRCTWAPAEQPVPRTPRSLEFTHADDPWELDLHLTLNNKFCRGVTAGFGPPGDADRESWNGLGQPAHVLAQPILSAYLAFHASHLLHSLPLVRLVELVLVLREDLVGREAMWRRLHGVLQQTSTSHFVYPALELVERLAPGTVDPDLRQHLHTAATSRMRRTLAGMRPVEAQRLSAASVDERLMWARGPMELLYAWSEFLWPEVSGSRKWWRVWLRRMGLLIGGRLSFRAPNRSPANPVRR